MANYPSDLKYTSSHEWVRLDGDTATVGITWHAQDSLGDVVHYEAPSVGTSVTKGKACAEIESVKAVSDIYSPLSGEIVAVNDELDGSEDKVNTDPYGAGWLFKVRLSNASEVATLLDAASYQASL